jgi:hypothetical protein
MFTNRISKIVLVLLALAVVLVSVSFATYSRDRSHVAFHGNAAREYQLGEQYGQMPSESVIDSATRSYTAQAKAVACAEYPTDSLDLDSATRSYIAWAKSLECK